MQGTKLYERFRKAYENKEDVPQVVPSISKEYNDILPPGNWAENFKDTKVNVEWDICYWSCILKSAERNYSPTEREALALKEALIKFQPYIEGERILAIMDHAAITWS